jgi:host factor-I protein
MDFQNEFLEEIKKSNKTIKIFLIKGVPLLGTIEGYDKFSIVIKVNGKQQTIYKHAISTIMK